MRAPLLLLLPALGCADKAADTSADPAGSPADTSDTGGSSATMSLDPALFDADGLVSGTTIAAESCTLSGGTVTECYRIVVRSLPAEHDMGPYCPASIDDEGADAGGMWEIDEATYEVDGPFIAETIPELYGESWLLYDPQTGLVNVTDPVDGCAQVAEQELSGIDPAEAELTDHCIVCDTQEQEIAFLIPVQPVAAAEVSDLDTPTFVTGLGLGLNGVPFFPPEPVQRITAYENIAPLDDCGGHGGFAFDYHYHRPSPCAEGAAELPSPLLGYALDGYAIYGAYEADGAEPDDLDGCRGHATEGEGYHYHAAPDGYPYFVGCLSGEIGCVQRGPTLGEACDATAATGGPP